MIRLEQEAIELRLFLRRLLLRLVVRPSGRSQGEGIVGLPRAGGPFVLALSSPPSSSGADRRNLVMTVDPTVLDGDKLMTDIRLGVFDRLFMSRTHQK